MNKVKSNFPMIKGLSKFARRERLALGRLTHMQISQSLSLCRIFVSKHNVVFKTYAEVLKVHGHCPLSSRCSGFRPLFHVVDSMDVIPRKTEMYIKKSREIFDDKDWNCFDLGIFTNFFFTIGKSFQFGLFIRLTWSLPPGKNPQQVRHFEPARERSAGRAPDLRCKPRAPMDIGLSSDHNRSGKGFPNSSYPHA